MSGTFITNGDDGESEFRREYLLAYRTMVTMISRSDEAETISVVVQAAML